MDLFTCNFIPGKFHIWDYFTITLPAIQQYFSYVRVKQNTTKEVDVKIEQYEPN